MKPRSILPIFALCLPVLSGCVSLLKTSPGYQDSVAQIKTIAVLPADIQVYKHTAGGVRELMDEWSDAAKQFARDALQKNLSDRYSFQLKFVDEKTLKAEHRDVWRKNEALYGAVARSALMHAYPGPNAFSTKTKEFDYTMGEDVQELSKAVGADALLFLYGFDHEATSGRVALWWFNFAVGAATGVYAMPSNPSAMMIGLVNGTTGQVEWFKVTPPESEYSFRKKEHINVVIEWLTRDLIKKKK